MKNYINKNTIFASEKKNFSGERFFCENKTKEKKQKINPIFDDYMYKVVITCSSFCQSKVPIYFQFCWHMKNYINQNTIFCFRKKKLLRREIFL
jgi:hypothetical protein